MTLTVLLVLAILALICAIMAAAGKCPLWVSVILLALYVLILQLPIGSS